MAKKTKITAEVVGGVRDLQDHINDDTQIRSQLSCMICKCEREETSADTYTNAKRFFDAGWQVANIVGLHGAVAAACEGPICPQCRRKYEND